MDDCYPLNSQPVGLCLIINNEDFTRRSHYVERGSDADAHSLAEVLSELGFRVLKCKDQTKDQMQQTLTWFSSLTDPALPPQEFRVKEWSDTRFTETQQPLKHGDAFICCFHSHGDNGAVLGTDQSPLYIQDITKTFKATEQSVLKGKPKVFLIEAGQGYEKVHPDEAGGCSIPLEADVLFAFAAADGFNSYKHVTAGSLFIQSVCQQLRERCPRGEDLTTILNHVKNDVNQKCVSLQPGKVKQVPVVVSTMTKYLVFSPHGYKKL